MPMRTTHRMSLLAALAVLGPAMANGQAKESGPATYPAQNNFPQEDAKSVARHLAATRQIAGADLEADFNWRCLVSPLDRQLVFGVQHDGLVPATKIFDNFYSVGQNAVSAFALDTPEGIILIDALNNEAEAREIIVPNLVKLGLDPKRIRYVLITHGHGDHWGGAKYLQDIYGAKIVASEADWRMMESPQRGGGPFAGLVPPKRDIVAKDGDTVALGGTSIRLYVTPGHTPGVLSLLFPVFDKGVRHMAGLMGGTGGGQDEASVRQQLVSLARWQALTKATGVDVLVTNHPVHMAANEKQALIRYGATGGRHPYVYGAARYQRYMQVMSGCSRVQLARMGKASD
ncbi:MBL fold metallo-hydrolase [Sphingomonas sp. SUN039]|uniref:MBL fold metallo-hydrolase n=1 Tax=Sphingomonas sp. SUN039 TaxID=2937787 RepID=UPI0021641A25|nr:MBL fold metallo-hydrolase [Sphingomonas sp. SUN039]UVO55680.1 MBL fold metallo-hydrolase [Sphingomonas sp. SUN039]